MVGVRDVTRRRAGVCWALVGLLLAGCAGEDAGGKPEAAGGGRARGGFEARYESVGRGHARDLALLRSGRVLEAVARRLGERVRMPVSVPMVARECGADDPAYDPDARRIDVCVEQVGAVRERFARAGKDDGDAAVTAVLEETLLHESAHAVIDVLRLPITGREEDVADQFAAIALIGQGPAGEDKLLAAATDYALGAAEAPPTDEDLLDEHSLDGQRAATYVCYVYGARPGGHRDLVDGERLTEERAEGCPDEWAQARRGWQTLLRPYLVRPL